MCGLNCGGHYTEVDIKYFIRSYRSAFETLINRKIDKDKLGVGLKKVNKLLVKQGKKKISMRVYKSSLLKKILEHTLYIQIDDIELTLFADPSVSHLGNCRIHEIGKYCDIWPILNLITDCKTENNQKLAEKFLTFADSPSKFTRADLVEINPKFSEAGFDTTTDYYCKFLTGIAMLYVFYEPARRIVLTENEEDFDVEAPEIPIASSMIVVLKALRDGHLDSLDHAFSPESKYILITKQQVSSLNQQAIQSAVKGVAALGLNRVKEKYGVESLDATDIAKYVLYANSEEFNPEDTEEYPGKTIKITSSKSQ